MATPFENHWLPLALLEVRSTLPLPQKLVGPPALTVGVGGVGGGVRPLVWPAEEGPPSLAVGVAGVAPTTTLVVPAAEVQPLTVTVRLYVPASAVVALARVGFCAAEVKPFGPVQA